jgi:NadR type nicotinamide-nucleotide adenylyltransferase
MVQKIVIIGPESTGKSTLSKQLAAHYKTSYVPEFARSYLENKKDSYQFEDLYSIAVGQLALEDELEETLRIQNPSPAKLIIDTDLSVIKVWSEFVFNKCDNRILTQIAQRSYHLYLLCATDLPWVKDDLREYPELATREKIYHYYKDFVVNQATPWADIRGDYEERLAMAINAIDNL